MRAILSLLAAAGVALSVLTPLPAEAASPALERIQKTKTFTVGYRKDSVPFSFELDGKPTGYSVDLCQRIAAGLQQQLKLDKLDVKFVPVTVKDRLDAVAKGRVDIECGSTTASLSRMEQVDFSLMTFVDGAGLLVKVDSPVTKLTDLVDKKVAVIPGTTTEGVLKRTLERSFIKADIVPVKEHSEGLTAVESGAVAAYVSDRGLLVGLIIQAKNPQSLTLTPDVLSFEPYALALPRNDADFRLAVNRVLARLFRTGEVADVYKRWFGRLGDPSPGLLFMYRLQGLPE
jgi:ABC-type amino acid transport substrate-binding protein